MGYLIALALLTIPIIWPFFQAGYFPTHDGLWAVVRLGDMVRELRDLQIPARFSGNLNFGYGYPLFNFTYPLPYYLGSLIHLAGFGLTDSIKILFLISVPLSAIFMFLAAREYWKNTAGAILAAVIYAYFPYRLVDLYVRGSLGESLSFVLFPLIVWLLLRKNYLFAGAAFALLIGTHNIMAVLFLPVILFFGWRKPGFLIFGLALSAFFWLPALAEKQFILLSKIPIADRTLYFINPVQLITPKWGYGVPIDPNGFGYFLGGSQIITLLLAFRHPKFLPLAAGYFFFLFPVSAPVWQNTPLLKEINYPWTLLAPLGFLAAFLAGTIKNRLLIILLAAVSILTVLPHARPEKYINEPDGLYLTNDATTTSSNELMPLWVKVFPSSRPAQKIVTDGQISQVFVNSKTVGFSGRFANDSITRLNLIYYPGWQVKIDGKQIPVSYANDRGLIEFPVPAGNHRVEANFTDTPVRRLANAITLTAAMFLLLKTVHSAKSVIRRK